MNHVLSIAIILASALVFSSCAVDSSAPPPKAGHVLYEWNDDGGPGAVTVKINLAVQKAYVQRGGRPIAWCYVATGKEGRETPSGSYHVMEKIEEKYSNKYGWVEDAAGNVVNGDATPSTRLKEGEKYFPAPMPYWQRITAYGIGMHIGNIPKPGEPASHGCIRMPKEFAPLLYQITKVGTPVKITRESIEPAPAGLAETPLPPAPYPVAQPL
jgi:lipoprotein-anchoring transpeptidase ErfK/SrfK